MAEENSSEKVVNLPTREAPEATINNALLLVAMLKDILNARLLAVLALIGAVCLWGYTIYDPLQLRLWASSLYSILVLCPLVALYAKKGD